MPWSLWKSLEVCCKQDMNDFVNTVADFIELDFLPDGRHSRGEGSGTFEQLGTDLAPKCERRVRHLETSPVNKHEQNMNKP